MILNAVAMVIYIMIIIILSAAVMFPLTMPCSDNASYLYFIIIVIFCQEKNYTFIGNMIQISFLIIRGQAMIF